jgi:hypothetical protein
MTLLRDQHQHYDLRFLGQSVATIKIKGDNVKITNKDQKAKKNDLAISTKTKWDEVPWQSNEAREFRALFKSLLNCEVRFKEHRVESILLKEFSRSRKRDKSIYNIQPVCIAAGAFFQMPTPIAASQEEPTYSPSSGHIDILSRVRHKDNKVRLCVMELKYKYEQPTEVMKQAVAYATFIAQLLRSNSGQCWYELFGFTGSIPKDLLIDVAVVMPEPPPHVQGGLISFGECIEVCSNTHLKLYSLYYFLEEKDKIPKFSGSLDEELMK